jgi:hypothetical protein
MVHVLNNNFSKNLLILKLKTKNCRTDWLIMNLISKEIFVFQMLQNQQVYLKSFKQKNLHLKFVILVTCMMEWLYNFKHKTRLNNIFLKDCTL